MEFWDFLRIFEMLEKKWIFFKMLQKVVESVKLHEPDHYGDVINLIVSNPVYYWRHLGDGVQNLVVILSSYKRHNK